MLSAAKSRDEAERTGPEKWDVSGEIYMEDEKDLMQEESETSDDGERELLNRRNFLRGLGKWSLAVIGGVALGAVAGPSEASGWVNTRGSWINGPGAGGWANRGASWINGGGAWINRGGTWVNGGGGGWINGRGGGAWVNRRGW
jgi:hypothetical protein